MSDLRIREAGDAALLLEFEPVVDAGINDRAIAAADVVRREGIPGLRDVLSTYRTVVAHLDPLAADVAVVRRAFERAASLRAATPRGRSIDVPVVYGGEYGPDLKDVAADAGVSPQQVVEWHAGREYRVFMLGFLPGFAYMGDVDARIAAPRRATPRARVPAGAVGIAGRQTGIYPFDSPGGWQIIGRSPLRMFDPSRAQPALVSPGDRVRFIPADAAAVSVGAPPTDAVPEVAHDSRRSVAVLRPGFLTTVQDTGRWGYQGLGVPVAGAMDLSSHRLANALVGNGPAAATLEITLAGPELRMESSAIVAVTGTPIDASLDGVRFRLNAAVHCREGSVLRLGRGRAGGRAYVAITGGIDTPLVLGSRSTHVRTRMGGLAGRPLRAGDRLPLGTVRRTAQPRVERRRQDGPRRPHAGGAVLRVQPGPQDDFFPPSAFDVLQTTRFTVTPQSDRMGYRLAAERTIPRLADREMISDATYLGALQVPPSGAPILLMADRQTTGGYPQIAIVITADLPLAGQLVPGDWVEFRICSRAEAREALVLQEQRLNDLA